MRQNARCSGPLSRRSFLEIGGLSACGLGLGEIERLRAESIAPGKTSSDTSVIFVWLPGGPPHMEMYDMKPDAPSDYRGEFRPSPTNVSGLDVCELMPMHTRCADRYNIVRSVRHSFSDHGGGHKRFLTGREPAEPTGFVNDAPMAGSLAIKSLEGKRKRGALPGYIALVKKNRHAVDVYSFGSAYLGVDTHPFIVHADPNEDGFKIESLAVDSKMIDRLDDRVGLLKGVDSLRRDIDSGGVFSSMDHFNTQALEMLGSAEVSDAFDLSREDGRLRERYGRHSWGQRAILARRLVEAGASFVTVVMENPYVSGVKMLKNGTYNWDSHAVNCHLFDDAKVRLPIYDRVITAMVEDLYERGLDKRVLLVVTGEFGRTPRLRTQVGTHTKINQPGRDHWPSAMSMLLAGGGMRTGQVIGATNKKGEHPVERTMTPNDVWATIYHHLGIDLERAFNDYGGRPMSILPFGEPIRECLPA
jgi:hypothetical protein